ncbi:hypothetical protein C1645_872935 [Glomus cerebriforme]|uniref:G-protein coupled receptors family 1 profile domain-containing protein n=1 Tax=Glomus cerebriforme TaxID=658196 RepID=A0A397TAC1_9GLOM|nr:hypothetical protein C1645_872935 [Glomus cerebriforme]
MVSITIIIVYFICFISVICGVSTALKLYLSGKNYLIAVLAASMAVGELDILSSVIWINDFQNVPKSFCIFQALLLQYAVYLQIIAAVCFSYHIYQLLVHYKKGSSQTLQKIYVSALVGGPIIMTIIAAIVSIKTDAVRPFALNCDFKKPIWVRLIGYSGFNFVLTFFGVYLSARAAYQVFKHLDQFKSNLSNGDISSNSSSSAMVTNHSSPEIQIYIDNTDETNVETTEINTTASSTATVTSTRQTRRPVTTQTSLRQIKAYNMTKAAAIRMVLFSCGFALINVAAAFQTITTILKQGLFGEVVIEGLGGNDFAGVLSGLMIFLVFGLPNGVKKCFSRRR